MSIYTNDANKKFYSTLGGDHNHTLTGVGDVAYWFQPVQNQTNPWVQSHKGDVICEVAPGDNVDDMTLPQTGNPPLITIAQSDADAFAIKEAALCKDAFTVSG